MAELFIQQGELIPELLWKERITSLVGVLNDCSHGAIVNALSSHIERAVMERIPSGEKIGLLFSGNPSSSGKVE